MVPLSPLPDLNYVLEGWRTLRALTCLASLAPLAGLAPSGLPAPLLRFVPRGDGRPVFVLPGLYAGNGSTAPLRAFLRRIGYTTHGWRLGRNLGPTEALGELPATILELGDQGGGPVTLIGWSLGGVYAREVARVIPEAVRQVITLGSPFNVPDVRTVRFGHRYRSFRRGGKAHEVVDFTYSPEPLPMPSTAIFSRNDGFVDWETAVQEPSEGSENIEVRGSHLGLGFNPSVLLVIGDRLGRVDDVLPPFDPPFPFRLWYPRLGQPVVVGGEG